MASNPQNEWIEDRAFVETYMYHGKLSRRPLLRLVLGLGFAAALIGTGVWIYFDLAAWEEAGKPARNLSAAMAAIYALGGKLLVLAFMSACGLFMAYLAIAAFHRDQMLARRGRRS